MGLIWPVGQNLLNFTVQRYMLGFTAETSKDTLLVISRRAKIHANSSGASLNSSRRAREPKTQCGVGQRHEIPLSADMHLEVLESLTEVSLV